MAKQPKATTSQNGEVFAEDMVTLVGTGKASFIPKDKQFKCHKLAADKLVAQGKATVLTAMFLLMAFFASAQISFVQPLRAGTSGANVLSDSVSSTGTAFLTSPAIKGPYTYSTIEVVVTKISGTVGGTISLMGAVSSSSNDYVSTPALSPSFTSASATSFSAIKTLETQTAVATITAADASAVYHWRIYGNPFQRYRVSWTGSSGQLASFTAKILTR